MSSQYPGAQYPGAQHPGAPVPPATPTRRGGGLALVGLLLAAAAIVIQLFGQITQAVIFSTRAYDLMGGMAATTGILSALLALAAVIVSAIALSRKERPALAGIGLGAGGVLVLGEIGSLLYSGVLQLTMAY